MDKEECLTWLHELLQPGDTVYGKIERVSQSSMSRCISFYVVDAGRSILDITRPVAKVTGHALTKEGYLRVSGCGMDMIFSVVYDLSSALWISGYHCSASFLLGYDTTTTLTVTKQITIRMAVTP